MSAPFLDPSFHIRWSALSPEHLVLDIRAALRLAEEGIDRLCIQDRGRAMTFKSTFLALTEATAVLDNAWSLVNHLDNVCDSKALREAHDTVLPEVTSFYARISLNESLWDLLKTYSGTKKGAALTGIQKRLQEETMADFISSGADLNPEDKKRFEALAGELATLTQKYSQNVLDSTNAWEKIITDPALLEGLPLHVVEAAREDAKAKGHGSDEQPAWRFTLKQPSYAPVMEYAASEELRKEVWQAVTGIGRSGKYDNTQLVKKILDLRHEKARLLGKENFPDLVTERRMAKSGKSVQSFIQNLFQKSKEFFDKEVVSLQEFRAETLGEKPRLLEPWEVAFWSEKRRKALFDFDQEETKPYFSVRHVMNGMFRLCEKLFQISITEKETIYYPVGDTSPSQDKSLIEVWHPEVKYYEIANERGVHIGSFYTDWHPRESKRGGAWMGTLKTGVPPRGDQERELHLGLICGNMTPPSADKPALLTHREVETVFHEFGHLLHHLLGNVEIKALNGICVAWDFVELPSQIMENFCWERESLDFFARHYETGEPIPEKLYRKMLKAKNFHAGIAMMRQLSFAKLDVELHTNPGIVETDRLDETCRELLQGYLMPMQTTPPSSIRSFTHLFSNPTGYASGYYSYKWAEVLEADAFQRFKNEGVLNGEVGKAFRTAILSKGNSEEPGKLFRNFMGREPNPDALLERAGLVK